MSEYEAIIAYLDERIETAEKALKIVESAKGLPGYAVDKVTSALCAYLEVRTYIEHFIHKEYE